MALDTAYTAKDNSLLLSLKSCNSLWFIKHISFLTGAVYHKTTGNTTSIQSNEIKGEKGASNRNRSAENYTKCKYSRIGFFGGQVHLVY